MTVAAVAAWTVPFRAYAIIRVSRGRVELEATSLPRGRQKGTAVTLEYLPCGWGDEETKHPGDIGITAMRNGGDRYLMPGEISNRI
jgi:hypothetical protein